MTRSSEAEVAVNVAGRSVFVLSVFASAFLIFLVQPLVGKRILPWFGGAPAVWTLCLAFYQTTLFLGYAYAHLLIRFAPASRQLAIHSILVAAALFSMPVLPGEGWKPTGVSSPNADILSMLGASVALPFLVLASTGPLVQAWFTRRLPGRSPYPLYAVSNLGSLLALFAYPLVVEPRLGLSETDDLWSVAFGLTSAGVLTCAALARRAPLVPGDPRTIDPNGGSARVSVAQLSLWLLLSACAVVLLMGVTNKLCLDIASVPLLWVLPLGAYLLTLVLSFASERAYRRPPLLAVALVTLVVVNGKPLWFHWTGPEVQAFFGSVYTQIVAYCLLLFSLGMVLHGELYRIRPPPRALTAFYLFVAGGGALGGLFVGIAAPLLFDGYYELEVGLVLAWLLVPLSNVFARAGGTASRACRFGPTVASAFALALLAYVGTPGEALSEGIQHRERSFFGVLRVRDGGKEGNRQRHLESGTTLHGLQFLIEEGGRWPSSYYGRATAIGLLMGERGPEVERRIGVIGLGAGTLAAYGREGDLIRFYEIDPIVVRIARDDGYFDFLSKSLAETEIVVGDARLSLVRERSQEVDQDFDILVIDAFSSDAIPVHLLTREAFSRYVDALAPDGLIAVHATNRHLDLMSQVARQGLDAGLEALQVKTSIIPRHQSQLAEWVLLGRDADRLAELAESMNRHLDRLNVPRYKLRAKLPKRTELLHISLWTDDYSDVFGLMVRSRKR